ncbi:MAG: hypothetical protein SF066_11310 [Thermoanaerobaculia bacterium]|nr:hypothetical protein [Thermoanaerobaculia bacterium]
MRHLAAVLAWSLLSLPSAAVESDLFAEARLGHDLATLNLLGLDATSDEEAWVVLAIEPAPASGRVRLVGVVVGSGTVTTTGEVGAEATVEGRAEVLQVLSGRTALRSLTYRWPFEHLYPRGEDAAAFSPLRGGGSVVARVKTKPGAETGRLESADQLASLFLIPKPWQGDLAGARAALLKDAVVFAQPAEPQNAARLERLLTSPNPFVTLAAFRALASVRSPERAAVLRERLTAAHGVEQSALVVVALANGLALDDRLPQVPEASALEPRAWAIGAAAAMLYGQSPELRAAGRQLLLKLEPAFATGESAPNRDLVELIAASAR